MALCKFTSESLIDGITPVDNIFINEYLPYAPENAVRVYIFGLYLCSMPLSADNSAESMASILNLPVETVVSSFMFWEEQGIVQIVSKVPLEVKYLSIKSTLAPVKKYKAEKFADFNNQLQQLFPTRMITVNEYNEYYYTMDTCRIEPEAMLMIIQYCVNLKGVDVRYPYILTIAKDWAKDGIRTYSDVEQRLKEHEATSSVIGQILKILGKKSSGTLEEREYYIKWTKSWGFDDAAIMFAAKQLKSKGTIKRLDSALDEYYRMNIFSEQDMDEYAKHRKKMYEIAKNVNKIIGVYYETLDYIVEQYVNVWLQKGWEEDALYTVAQYCFKSNIRTLNGVNNAVTRFTKLGLITTDSINEYLNKLLENDEKIMDVIHASGSNRNVSTLDRELYKTWTSDWGFNQDIITYAASLATDKAQAFGYINRVLSRMHENKIYTLEQAKTFNQTSNGDKKVNSTQKTDFTKTELTPFFGDLENFDDIEV